MIFFHGPFTEDPLVSLLQNLEVHIITILVQHYGKQRRSPYSVTIVINHHSLTQHLSFEITGGRASYEPAYVGTVALLISVVKQ